MQERVPLSRLAELPPTEAVQRLERLRTTDLTYHDPDAELESKSGPVPPKQASVELLHSELEQLRPSEEERALVKDLFTEGDIITPDKLRAGPHYKAFLQCMDFLQAELDRIGPNLTAEHLAPHDYQSDKTKYRHDTLSSAAHVQLERLARWRTDYLDALADAKIHPATATQVISPDTLDIPPFSRATDQWRDYRAGQACTSACFKMIFQSISGYRLSQAALGDALVAKYRTPIVHDEILLRTLKTPTFRRLSQKKVATAEYIGTDLEQIQTATTAIKRRFDDAQVFCMINLSSRTASRRTWHTSVLLAADDQKVVYHDPSSINGGAYITEPRDSFARRWAQSYNRARLVIATPDKP